MNKIIVSLIGKAGVGKSTLGNMMLGFQKFKESANETGTTDIDKANYLSNEYFRLDIIDTVGLFEINPSENIKKAYDILVKETIPSSNCILLCIDIGSTGRITHDLFEPLKYLNDTFQQAQLDNKIIICLTKFNKLETEFENKYGNEAKNELDKFYNNILCGLENYLFTNNICIDIYDVISIGSSYEYFNYNPNFKNELLGQILYNYEKFNKMLIRKSNSKWNHFKKLCLENSIYFLKLANNCTLKLNHSNFNSNSNDILTVHDANNKNILTLTQNSLQSNIMRLNDDFVCTLTRSLDHNNNNVNNNANNNHYNIVENFQINAFGKNGFNQGIYLQKNNDKIEGSVQNNKAKYDIVYDKKNGIKFKNSNNVYLKLLSSCRIL